MSQILNNMDRCKAVILVGGRDFGRCPLASSLNRVLWPVFDKPALQVLLEQLAGQGIRRVVVSCEGQADVIRQAIQCPPQLSISFQQKTLPRGPAGCIRDAAEPEDECLLVLPGNAMIVPPLEDLFQKHRRSQADMTVFLNPNGKDDLQREDSQIYLCEPTILSCIPETGFVDLKEGFIPVSMKSGLTIRADVLPHDAGHYRTWNDYLIKLKSLLIRAPFREKILSDYPQADNNPDLWLGANVRMAENVKIFGPVVIGENTSIAGGTIIFGPTVIGKNVKIGPDCLIEESVLWDRVAVGEGSRIYGSLVDAACTISQLRQVSNELVPFPRAKLHQVILKYRQKRICKRMEQHVSGHGKDRSCSTLNQLFHEKKQKLGGMVLIFLVTVTLIFSYGATLKRLFNTWMRSDEYSSGLLVPVIAVYILWLRRKSLSRIVVEPSIGAFGLLLAAQVVRFFGLYYRSDSAERLSFVFSIGAIVYFLMGRSFFKKIIPIFLFLFLMLPLPKSVESYLTAPLQSWATVSSVFCLETLGFSVARQGNVIDINGTLVAVAEACNGLRMLTAFIVVCGLGALTINRQWPVKLVILLSSIPIALACNTLRLTITAIAFTKLDTVRWEKIFHDFGGFAMMPVALLIIVLELWLLSRLVIEPKNKQQQVIYRKECKSS